MSLLLYLDLVTFETEDLVQPFARCTAFYHSYQVLYLGTIYLLMLFCVLKKKEKKRFYSCIAGNLFLITCTSLPSAFCTVQFFLSGTGLPSSLAYG